jgi:hypothetical protein
MIHIQFNITEAEYDKLKQLSQGTTPTSKAKEMLIAAISSDGSNLLNEINGKLDKLIVLSSSASMESKTSRELTDEKEDRLLTDIFATSIPLPTSQQDFY